MTKLVKYMYFEKNLEVLRNKIRKFSNFEVVKFDFKTLTSNFEVKNNNFETSTSKYFDTRNAEAYILVHTSVQTFF